MVIDESNTSERFSFTPSESGYYSFYSEGGYDTYAVLYDADLNELITDDDGGVNYNFNVRYSLSVGTSYIYEARMLSSEEYGSFSVYLEKGKDVESIEVTELPDKTTYIENSDGYWDQRWDEDLQDYVQYYYYDIQGNGLELTIHYTDGSSADWSYDEDGSYFNGYYISLVGNQYDSPWQLGVNTVTVTYMGAETTFAVEVVESPVASIEVTKLPDKTTYIENLDGYWDYRWDEDLQDEVPYYYYNIQGDGLELTIHYTDGSSADWSYSEDGSSFNGYDISLDGNQYDSPWQLGSNIVTVTYMGAEATFDVTVAENPVASIEVTKLPDKTEYIAGLNYGISRTGMEIKIYYTDGTSVEWNLNNGSKLNGYYINFDYDDIVVGANTITVTYIGKSTTFEVTGIENPVASIKIIQLPVITTYELGFNLLCDGLKMQVNYKDGSSKILSFGVDGSDYYYYSGYNHAFVDGYDWVIYAYADDYYSRGSTSTQGGGPGFGFILGENTVYVDYMGYTETFTVQVVQTKTISEIELSNVSSTGEAMGVNVNYTDGTSFAFTCQALTDWGYTDGLFKETSFWTKTTGGLVWAYIVSYYREIDNGTYDENNVDHYEVYIFGQTITVYPSGVPIISPAEGSSTVIDTVNRTIYGLSPGISSLDGLAEVEEGYYLEYNPTPNGFGTGTVVNVMIDGEIVESYIIIIFGDVNGDGLINAIDADICALVQNWMMEWDETEDAAFLKAGDVNGDERVDSVDADIITLHENWLVTIDQTTGLAG